MASDFLNKLGDTVLSTKLDFLYGFLSNVSDTGIKELASVIKSQVGIDITNPDVLATLDDTAVDELRKCAFNNFNLINDLYVQYKATKDTADTQHARDMYLKLIESNKENKFFKYFAPLFGLIVTICVLTYVFAITFFDIPEKNIRFADTIIGFLLGILSSIIGFFFGSSDTTKNKSKSNNTQPNNLPSFQNENERLPRE